MTWHSKFGGREWATDRLTIPPRLLSRDSDGVRHVHRTLGEPTTIRRYLKAWGPEIRAASKATGVPVPIILATIATENGPAKSGPTKGLLVRPIRKEPGYVSDRETPHRISVGPCHLLLSTAKLTRAELSDLGTNLLAAAKYIASQKKRTGLQPIFVAAAYNSGGIYDASNPASRFHNRWHLRSYGDHLDRWADWMGDALTVTGDKVALAGVTREARPFTVTGRKVPVPVSGRPRSPAFRTSRPR